MGQINNAHKKFAVAPRHSYCVRSFAFVMETCVTIRGQYWMKAVIVEMAMMPKTLMTMTLQTNNEDDFFYVIL